MKPVLKEPLQAFLKEKGFSARTFYRITQIDNPLFLRQSPSLGAPPAVGESFAIEYDYRDDDTGYFGYEHLNLFIGRQDAEGHIRNYVRRFSTVTELAEAMHGVTFELDQDYGRQQVQRLQGEIDKMKLKYKL